MKKIPFFVFLVIVLSCAKAQKPYQIKSCKIEFSFNNGMQAGTKTLIIADSGAYEKEEVVAKTDTAMLTKSDLPAEFKTFSSWLQIVKINTPDSSFSVDLNSSIITRNLRPSGSNNFFLSMTKLVAQDTFIGRKCEIRDVDGFKLWFWKGICLKKEMDVGGAKIYEYATAIDENYVIMQDEFILPKGMTITQ